MKRYRIPFDVNARVVDYDMRGYWRANRTATHQLGQHFPDTYKTPYDTTFSRESKYATRDNPFEWKGDELIDLRTGAIVFGGPNALFPAEGPEYYARAYAHNRAWALAPPDSPQRLAASRTDERHVRGRKQRPLTK